MDDVEAAADTHDWDQVIEVAAAALALDASNEDALAFREMAQQARAASASRDGGRTVVSGDTSSSGPPLPSAGESREPALSKKGEGGLSSPIPVSFANDRYQVSRFLGEGGKKRVYQAHDTLLDREVAFALIRTEGFDETARSRVTREAQAMGRLGTHPNIVTVFDLGIEGSEPYMVTELMGGGDVEALLEVVAKSPLPAGEGEGEGEAGSGHTGPSRASGHGGLSLERTIEIGKAVCEGLEFAHARDIVHRDLKPGNVWLTEDGTAKIGDFGLAMVTDRSRLTMEGMMVGTVSYMPPEQATGGQITPKADLYSLGAMLYEMVTGRPPFLGDDEIAIIGQHINTPPVAPTWHNGDCPRPLEALIVRLLSKDPSARPESAADVLSALDAIDVTARGETVERESASLDSLAGGVFVGRQAEMDQLKAALEDVLGGSGRLVTLVGEPGIGKTRTSEELATYAGLRGAQVLWGRCYETGGQPPYWPWIQAIRGYIREVDPDELRRQMGSSASIVAEIISDVRDRLPETQPAAPMDDPESARFRLFDSIASFLRSASQSRPLVFVLDDLHWSDRPSLALLEFMAREIGQSRVMLLCTYRDMELNRRHPLTVTLGDLARERLYERVLLRGLTEPDVARFIEIAAGFAPPGELSATVYRHTEGNPLFVTEVVRDLVQSGELADSRVSGNSTWSVRIPEGVREVIGRRLDRLSERANELLTVAAVVGRDFRLEPLKELSDDTTESQLLDVLDEALDARIIEELSDEIGHYQFTHALMQETLTGELSLTRRVRLHARIAETLETLYGDHADEHATELAYHFVEAEAVAGGEKLAHYSEIAGEGALAKLAHDEALGHFKRALASLENAGADQRIAALRFGSGLARAALRDHEEALVDLTAAFDIYEDAENVDRAVAVARTRIVGGEARFAMVPIIERALKIVDPGSADEGWLQVFLGRGLSMAESSTGPSLQALRRAAEIARDLEDEHLELMTVEGFAFVHAFQNGPRITGKQLQRGVTLSDHIDDPVERASVYRFHAATLLESGQLELGQAALEVAKTAAIRSGDRERLSSIYWMIMLAAVSNGDWDLGRSEHEAQMAVWPEDPRPLAVRAQIEYEVGEFERGDTFLERIDNNWDREAMTGRDVVAPTNPDTVLMVVAPTLAHIKPTPHLLALGREAADSVLAARSVGESFRTIAEFVHAFIAKLEGNSVEAAIQHELIDPAYRSSRGIELHLVGARLAHMSGHFDQSIRWFEKCIELYKRETFRTPLAWTYGDYAETLLDRDEPGDREKAIELQDEALAITQELGMRPLTERILARREILRA